VYFVIVSGSLKIGSIVLGKGVGEDNLKDWVT
jgi:hypothetical protein